MDIILQMKINLAHVTETLQQQTFEIRQQLGAVFEEDKQELERCLAAIDQKLAECSVCFNDYRGLRANLATMRERLVQLGAEPTTLPAGGNHRRRDRLAPARAAGERPLVSAGLYAKAFATFLLVYTTDRVARIFSTKTVVGTSAFMASACRCMLCSESMQRIAVQKRHPPDPGASVFLALGSMNEPNGRVALMLTPTEPQRLRANR